eukprot:CAMPEP_0178566588 /NCGR_PEP_ID=MMETSP0697-20121206/14838_1 /TAXON_ID=265572 /ORGANISM="Extubocellulus spinifer, Strain CCMP396" /LENGTH=329 /DNA_ID=CAMNT_0020200397 /DNA_START=325 /DNA_END=1314 /DNA_ORIENTATION=-
MSSPNNSGGMEPTIGENAVSLLVLVLVVPMLVLAQSLLDLILAVLGLVLGLAVIWGVWKLQQEHKQVKQREKLNKKKVCAAAENFVCPITHGLPLNPVRAEDGNLYDEHAIKEWFLKKQADGNAVTSPLTNAPIGTKLLPDLQVRNTIKGLVDNGVIDGRLVEEWKKAMDAKEEVEKTKKKDKVEETKKKAEKGDVEAMYNLALWYRQGTRGLLQSDEESYRWYKLAADLKDARAMALAGWCLVTGFGVEENVSHGMALILSAAERGSDYACICMGHSYLKGLYGLPEDKKEAIYWLKRATDGSCSMQHLKKEALEKAKAKLEELEANE